MRRNRISTYKKRPSIFKYIIRICLLGICLIASIYLTSLLLGPPKLLTDQNTVYYSHSGKIIGEERGAENRYFVPLDKISPDLIKSTIAVEDKNFYNHNGFDLRRIGGAILSDLRSLSLKEGASTLTQQYARNLYLTHEKTWIRKLKEAFYTIRLEMHYSKDEILEGYLNTIYFGHGAYGIEAASNYFFDKHANELSLAQSAMLAGIPKGPTYYSPLNNYEKAIDRQMYILRLLYEQQKISEAEYKIAMAENLNIREKKVQAQLEIGPHFQDTALSEVANILKLDPEFIRAGGYEIHTTLDIDLQRKLEGKAINVAPKNSEIEVGALAMDPETGGIKALVGGNSYEKSSFNRTTKAKRMPGSTFKPLLYYAALRNNYTASTKLMSKPTRFVLEDNEVYQPSNFNDYYANDAITLAQAIALSDNIYAVKTNIFLGSDKLVKVAREPFGITSDLPEVPSLALGTATVTVKEMVTAYGILANGKQKITGHTIEKILDRNGKVVYEWELNERDQEIDSANAFILTHLMTGMFDQTLNGYMSVTGASIADRLTRIYAGKSGTTEFDSWMIGYSPTLVTGVWTGYDDNRKIEKRSEVVYAKELWAEFMEDAHEGLPVEQFNIPDGIVEVPIDPVSGQIATPYCPSSRTMYFKKGTEPNDYCSTHFPDGENIRDEKIPLEDPSLIKRLFDLFSG